MRSCIFALSFLIAGTIGSQNVTALPKGYVQCNDTLVQEYCTNFTLANGVSCQRNNDTNCYNSNPKPDTDNCTTEAHYNCRSFISKYGYYCGSGNCLMSFNMFAKPFTPVSSS